MAVQVDLGGVPAEYRGRRGLRCVVGSSRWLVVVVTVTAVAQLLGGVTTVDGDRC